MEKHQKKGENRKFSVMILKEVISQPMQEIFVEMSQTENISETSWTFLEKTYLFIAFLNA